MKKMVIRLTPELREQLKNAFEKNPSEIAISYEDELSEGQLDRVQGGTDYGFGVSMPVTTSRSDGGGATVGRANFDVFTVTK